MPSAYKELDFSIFDDSYLNRFYSSHTEINIIILPILINGSQWGIFVCRREEWNDFELRHSWWRDSLNYKRPAALMFLFQKLMDRFLKSRGTWVEHNENYIINVLHFEAQRDWYSCGCYFIAAMHHVSSSCGIMQMDTYENKYSSDLTEAYRRCAVKCLLAGASDLYQDSGCMKDVTELDLLVHLYRKTLQMSYGIDKSTMVVRV